MQALAELLPDLKKCGHRVLIFSQWTSMLDILEWTLDVLGVTYRRLDGRFATILFWHSSSSSSSSSSFLGAIVFCIWHVNMIFSVCGGSFLLTNVVSEWMVVASTIQNTSISYAFQCAGPLAWFLFLNYCLCGIIAGGISPFSFELCWEGWVFFLTLLACKTTVFSSFASIS